MAKAQRNDSKKPPVADNSGKFPSDAPKDQSFPFQEKSGPMGQSGNEQLPFQEMQPSLPTQQISPAMTASLSSVLTRRYKNVSAMGDRTALMLNMNQPIFSLPFHCSKCGWVLVKKPELPCPWCSTSLPQVLETLRGFEDRLYLSRPSFPLP
jgi:hypothetical protein